MSGVVDYSMGAPASNATNRSAARATPSAFGGKLKAFGEI